MTRKYCWKTGCDVEATLSVIGGRWKPVLVCHLLQGRKRFGELRRLTPNATERMITLQLRELEADGVVARHVFAEVPPRVEYEVTDFGRSLEPILVQMQDWGRAFKERRFAAEAQTSEAQTSEAQTSEAQASEGEASAQPA
ncbi:MAG: helix-turn-helix domain-containing protein [Planctomycetota bacterium]